jgi:ATP-dependent Lhr-like helicase
MKGFQTVTEPDDPLDLFLPPVRDWFRQTFGTPTVAQQRTWPAIAAGQHTLLLAPTGSGKTLAAFLACLDHLWRHDPLPRGVRVLYVSPLKALNNDIYRNLQVPLQGITALAKQMSQPLPDLTLAVRTGDTPASERQRLLRHPPHLLITTPESLHLLLTSRARETLHGVTHCIIDEIHALCPNKRGVFLSLLLERLVALTPHGFLRIGLSATQRPLDTVARFLGGQELTPEGVRPRPVTIIDAGQRKDLDLLVVNPVEQFGPLPERTVWPSIYRRLDEEIRQHRSTIVFANGRRVVERITAQLNGDEEIARAHHGSVSLEARQQTEQALKEGRLPAVVATASLELGIDMGFVDLVCQVESPGNVARGLQRVGRAGHLVGHQSKGRLIPKACGDLLEQAVLAAEMIAGHVEELRVPGNCLDILAQQVVAMVAMDSWEVPKLLDLVRRAYPYRDLAPRALETVLEMITGRYRFQEGDGARPGQTLSALQPRISWDRTHNRLHALPGSQSLALIGGGTIPDTGQYAVYAPGDVRVGELDEEFIYESRIGDVFLLGTNAWRLDNIETDRVRVVSAEGAPAQVPFWRGEQAGRSYELGMAVGRLLRQLHEKLHAPSCGEWLQHEFHLDAAAARNLRQYVLRQLDRTGCLPEDTRLCIEASRDPLGDWQIILLSPYGTRLHLGLRLAIEARLRQRLGYRPQCLHHDDGLVIRLTDSDEPVLDLFDGLTPENVQELLLGELADSALFALRFRQNASRALLLPRPTAGKRAPLWLQRMRGRDLLQVARSHPDFPIVVETFRECLHDHLDLPRLVQLLSDLRDGRVRVATKRLETPSPFASELLFAFTASRMYQYDDVESGPGKMPQIDGQLLDQLLNPKQPLLDERAVAQVERRLRGVGQPPRNPAEMAEWLRRLGDLSPDELEGPMAEFLTQLEGEGRAARLQLTGVRQSERWVLDEMLPEYQQAFGQAEATGEARQRAAEAILIRFLETHALVGLRDVLERYPFDEEWARRKLEEWARGGRIVRLGREEQPQTLQWSAPANLDQIQRSTLAVRRNEVVSCPPAQFADFLTRWQGLHPDAQRGTAEGLAEVLVMLQGVALPAPLWEQTVLPGRVRGFQPRWLDEAVASGQWAFVGRQENNATPRLAFWNREQLLHWPPPEAAAALQLDQAGEQVLQLLQQQGALFVSDLAGRTGLTPGVVRSRLWSLLRQGVATNDRFDVIRRGEEALPGESPHGARAVSAVLKRARRASLLHPEGRWSLIPWGRPDAAAHSIFAAELLLQRYGIVARELALLDAAMPPWRVLYEVLSRMEMAGEVRRGYFVEGLHGAQFALPEAVQQLQDAATPSSAAAPVILLHSLDPANLYGTAAPLDIPLLEGGTQPLGRREGNWLMLRAGKPVLIVEQQGKRLTALASASREDLAAAIARLPDVLDRNAGVRHKLTVAEWNGRPVTSSEGKELLEGVGFVRDYREMTLYAVWR